MQRAAAAPVPHLESNIQRAILGALGAERDLLLMKNANGMASYVDPRTGDERRYPYGLLPGSPDLVGILRGRWFCLEVKQPGEKATAAQLHVHSIWRQHGAFVAVVTSVEEARAALDRARRGELS